MSDLDAKVYVAGHRGMVGSAIVRLLKERGYSNIITRAHSELDLTNQQAVRDFFKDEQPNQVYLAAAKVGGIYANNTYPAEFIYSNLMIESNVIHEAWNIGVKKLLFLGSSCIYPKYSPQPMGEDVLLDGSLEPTNEPYAIAKIAGIKLCESYNRQFGTDYRSVMPTNLYGVGDSYHLDNSHVIPGMIRRFHEAKMNDDACVVVWGTGTPYREFLYVDDMAEACVHIMTLNKIKYDEHTQPMLSHINVGSGSEVTIYQLAGIIKDVVGYSGEIVFDNTKPDGSPRKFMDSNRLNNLGWQPKTKLRDGLSIAYQDFLKLDLNKEA